MPHRAVYLFHNPPSDKGAVIGLFRRIHIKDARPGLNHLLGNLNLRTRRRSLNRTVRRLVRNVIHGYAPGHGM